MSSAELNAHTALKDIPLPFMEIVLSERFLLPPESLQRFQMSPPETIQDVSDLSGLSIANIAKILRECMEINETIWLNGTIDDFVDLDRTWVVDMRPMVGYDVDPLHPAARIFHHGNQAQQLELMRTLERVIILSATEAHAWSAAMALRLMGIHSFLLTKN